jgi:NAD(P)-dependent dehydrogenase (short-subunit alcohol dehydrogenase family)
MMRDLDDRVVLVTGGARGLGHAIARELASAGAAIVLADRSESVQETARDLSRQGHRTLAMSGDIGEERDVRAFVAAAEREFGRLDAIVNNAGTDVTKPLAELTIAEWDRVLTTNLRGPFLLCKAALPLLARRGGDIVNITSTAARRGWPNASAYHASKWGLLGLSHALHAELRATGVRVTAIVAGGMRTPFLLDRFPELDPQKLQDPADVARTVRFALTQPRASAIAELVVVPLTETSWP